MANHVRQQLREAIATAVTGLTTTGANVFPSQVYPVQQNQCPALKIYTVSESAQDISIHAPALQERSITVAIEICAVEATGADNIIDTAAKEVEVALYGGVTLGSKDVELRYTGIEIDWDTGDQPIGVGRMSFSATIYTAANAPDIAT